MPWRDRSFLFQVHTVSKNVLVKNNLCVCKAVQLRGSKKEGEIFEAENTLIIILSILAFSKNLPGLPVPLSIINVRSK